MCKEVLGASAESANAFAAQNCAETLATGERPTGATVGTCPITVNLSAAGWGEMRQVEGCGIALDDGSTVRKWLYELADPIADYKLGQTAPSVREVETYCSGLADEGDPQFVTVVQCVAEDCEDGACAPELCTDDDLHPCSALTCRAETAEGSLCDLDLDQGLCDDGAACTADRCTVNGCTSEPNDEACEPGPCQTAVCDPEGEGATALGCTYEDRTEDSQCDDGDPCTLDGLCQLGACVGTPMECTPGSATCAVEVCSGGICVAQPINSSNVCDDGVGCFNLFQCSGGACLGGGGQKSCDDGNECTIDACDGVDCVHISLESSACDDGDPCTFTDRCNESDDCAGIPKVCDDGDPCTAGACQSDSGLCVFSPIAGCDCCVPDQDKIGCAEASSEGCVCPGIGPSVCEIEETCCTGAWTAACVLLVNTFEADQCESTECGDTVCAVLETFLTCPIDCPSCVLDSECNDWNPCTDDRCEETATSAGECVNDFTATEGSSCAQANACLEASICEEGFCNGSMMQGPTCDGSCQAETHAPIPLRQRARAIDLRLLGDPDGEPTGAALFTVEDSGLRRFRYDSVADPAGPAFKGLLGLTPWKSKVTPNSVLVAGPSVESSVLFAASVEGIELFYVGAFELPPASLDMHLSSIAPDAMAVDELAKRLYAVGELGLEVLDVANNVFVPKQQLTTGEVADLLGVPMGRMVDVAVRGEVVYLLDEEAGLLVVDASVPSDIVLVGHLPIPELFPGVEQVQPLAFQLGEDAVFVHGRLPGPGTEHLVAGVFNPDAMDLAWSWQVSLEGHPILDMDIGPCAGLTFALGDEGIGWFAPPSFNDRLAASDGPLPVELMVRDLDFPVEAVVTADLCDEAGTGVGWVAVAGAGGGAAVVRAVTDAPGLLQEVELVGAAVRTGLATRVAVQKGPVRTLAFVADGCGLHILDADKEALKEGLRLYDITTPAETVQVETCSLGDGAGEVRDVISDGLGRVHALVAEGEDSVLVSLEDPAEGSPCDLCPACKMKLRPVQDPALWMEPVAGVSFTSVLDTEFMADIVVIGTGPSWLQIADVTRHADSAHVWLALSEEHFPEGVAGLSALALHEGPNEDILYLGTSGGPALLGISMDVLKGHDPVPSAGSITFRSELAPSDSSYPGRPVAMTVSDAGLLYAILDAPDELLGEADSADSVDGRLWIVDVSDPDQPVELYLGDAGAGDLANASDLAVVGDQLFIASHGRGLLVIDVSDPANPIVTSERPVEGQASGLALMPGAVLLASGRTPLNVVETEKCLDE